MASMPVFGFKVRRCRERPPSIKYSNRKAAAEQRCAVLIEHGGIQLNWPLKVRRNEKGHRRGANMPPMMGMFRLMPAAICGGVRLFWNSM